MTSKFGSTRYGSAAKRFTLQNDAGMSAEVLDYGAIIQRLHVPDAKGRTADVVLGYDDLAAYERGTAYHGAIVGRVAGRVRGGEFPLDGRTVRVTRNEGTKHLHGGAHGFSRLAWRATPSASGDSVVLEHSSPAGDEGYPGTMRVRVTYTLTPDNALRCDYEATTDAPTPLSMTQHAAFNLAGHDAGDILGHELTIHADRMVVVDADLLPTGELRPVRGTPFDFTKPHAIGERIDQDDEQLRFGAGYDHAFILKGQDGTLAPAARLADPSSGRVLELWTTEPALQLYTSNYPDAQAGKGGKPYVRRSGVCLETQRYPDALNQPTFPSNVLRPGEVRRSRTEFRFGVTR